VIFTAIYVANMLFFALAAITQEHLAPFSGLADYLHYIRFVI
jgi:hypothetical protein